MKRWFELQPHLRQLLGSEEFLTWIAPLEPLAADQNSLTLGSASSHVTTWVRDHLLRDIETVAKSRFGPDFRIHVNVSPLVHEQANPAEESDGAAAIQVLNPAFTFERFVVGPTNQFAAAAAEAVGERPGRAYNPLFIYGDSGLGKTHLLHAIAHRANATRTKRRVVYMTTEQFVNELINCIRRKRMEVFRNTFRAVDILLLDDIQFIGGKERTQEEFFHTFNALHSNRHQVVFTSDARPSDIPGLEERLRTRFMQGLIADIQPPDLETRCAILREKARAVGCELPEDVVLFIARRAQKNVRELEGCLNRTIAYADLVNGQISVPLVRTALSELLQEERQPTASDIIRFIAHHYGIRVADLKGRSNRRSIALPRQVAMYLIRNLLSLSFPEIGKLFDKHHSTVIYAVDSVQNLRQSNPDFESTLTSFRDHFS